MKKVFKQLSNAITAAEDTSNIGELYQLEDLVANALARGNINIIEAAELQADITVATDALQRGDYLADGFAARQERTLDELENL